MLNFEKAFNILRENYYFIIGGVITTILLAIIGTVVGLILGIFLAYGKNIQIRDTDSKFKKILKYIGLYFSRIYSAVFRGTPMMVQALVFKYLCLIVFGFSWEIIQFPAEVSEVLNGWLFAGLIVITLNTTAYMGEIIRTGLNGVDNGQIEGALALGMSKTKASLLIVLPQAIRKALPTIGNELIVNIKDSSVLNVIGVADLYLQLYSIGKSSSAILEIYLLLAVIYLILTLLSTLLIKLIEKKLDGKKLSMNIFNKKEDF